MDSSSPQSNPSLPTEDKPTQQHLSTPTKSPSAPANSTTHTDVPPPEFPDSAGLRRRCKTRAPQAGSPRNLRKPRRRFEHEVREEKDSGLIEEVGKQPRKRRQTARTKKEKPNSVPPSTSSPKSEEESGGDFDRVGQMVSDLIMWKDASKSTFWFGFGSLCLLSSCFTQGLNFSIFSALSQFGILFLGVSFFSNSISQGNMVEEKREVKLKEDDILPLAKLTLPALNFAISKMRALFSGEPSMTLKVIPFLLLGAEYGHLITIRRLCAIGFFISFSVPKLYSCYSAQINKRAECLKLWLLDAWSACTHKKKVLASVIMAFWNLSSIKTRIFTIFILLVLFRYLRQHVTLQVSEKEQQKAPVMPETEEKEPQQALVVWEQGCQN
ncbi:reticulon-like protein B18 isoform X2 [Vigna umbellata]|uniref:reticulon-like protein B18 isoform X1 n=1 Tax=Vigna umbellata TaxID=87088 RepID=UPI001F5E73C2|nr:reticulon-like protein B18 isoform X1 [Vigna umbellata]XP_047162432.1 reticulon-like protein B18 isoform X2 [Vigna umbellata]